MTDFTDELLSREPDPAALRRGEAIYRRATGTSPYAPADDSPRWGRRDHHAEFNQLCMARIYYSAGLVRYNDVSPAYRDEIGGRVDLMQMARDYIALTGQTPPHIDDKNAILTRALTSSDFPDLISNVVNRALLDGFDSAPECWPRFTRYLPVRDFRQFDVRRGASMPAPEEVEERGEVKPATLHDDGKEQAAVGNYLQRISITRAAILNADVQALTITPYEAGRAVSRAIGTAVFNLLTANAALGDGVALFHADHGNLDASAAAPSVDEVNTAFGLMGAQQNAAGEYLNLKPRFIIAGPAYASTLSVVRSATNAGNTDGESDGNIITLIDSRLSSSTKWFTSADQIHGGVLVAVLEGSEGQPRLERMTNAPSGAPDGVHFRLGYAFRVLCGNHKALTYNAGA